MFGCFNSANWRMISTSLVSACSSSGASTRLSMILTAHLAPPLFSVASLTVAKVPRPSFRPTL